MTQTQLAEQVGTSQAAIARLERAGSNPTLHTLDRILLATGHRADLALVPHPPSIDETLIASNLRRSPAERLRAHASAHRSVRKLAESMRMRSGAARSEAGG